MTRAARGFFHFQHNMQQSPYHVDPGFDESVYAYAAPMRPNNAPGASERALWLAVIRQAFMDANLLDDGRKAKSDGHARKSALEWLLYGRNAFTFVCEMAGLEAVHVRLAAQRAAVKKLGLEKLA